MKPQSFLRRSPFELIQTAEGQKRFHAPVNSVPETNLFEKKMKETDHIHQESLIN